MAELHLFPTILNGKEGSKPHPGTTPLLIAQMIKALKSYAQAVRVRQKFLKHSFRCRGATAQVLPGENLALIVQWAFWKRHSTAWRNMCLMQVMSPGSETQEMVRGISEQQFPS